MFFFKRSTLFHTQLESIKERNRFSIKSSTTVWSNKILLTIAKCWSFPLYIRSFFWTPALNPSGLWGVTKKKAGGFGSPTEMLLPSQVTLSTSACIYLTRAVSALQGSAVENTGEGGVAQGHPCHWALFSSTHKMRRKWATKIRCPTDYFLYDENLGGKRGGVGQKRTERERLKEL